MKDIGNTWGGLEKRTETLLEREVGLETKEREGATGIASVCAIFFLCSYSTFTAQLNNNGGERNPSLSFAHLSFFFLIGFWE